MHRVSIVFRKIVVHNISNYNSMKDRYTDKIQNKTIQSNRKIADR